MILVLLFIVEVVGFQFSFNCKTVMLWTYLNISMVFFKYWRTLWSRSCGF